MKYSKLYFAAPLFNPEERSFNETLATRLQRCFEVFLPQRDGLLIPGNSLTASDQRAMYQSVFEVDVSAMQKADVTFAVLNGRTIDEGVSFELGYSFSLGKRCVGYLTDSRVLLPSGINPMINGALTTMLTSEDELQTWIEIQAGLMAS